MPVKPKRENVFAKLAAERETKRLAREAAGEPNPVSPLTPEQVAAGRVVSEELRRTLAASPITERRTET